MTFLLKTILLCLVYVTNGYLYAEPQEDNSMRLRMGVYTPSLNHINRTDLQVSLTFWAQELIASQNNIKEAPVKLFDSILDMQEAFKQGELDFLVAPPMELAHYFKASNLGDGFRAASDKSHPNAIVLLVRRDKNINRLEDLKSKRLILLGPDLLSEVFLDRLTLQKMNKHYQGVFSTIRTNSQNNHIILDLFFDQADVGVVYESAFRLMLELNPQIEDKLKILESYPVLSKNISFFRRNYPHSQEIINLLLHQKSPRLQQIFEVFQTQDIELCNANQLESFEKFYTDYLDMNKKLKP